MYTRINRLSRAAVAMPAGLACVLVPLHAALMGISACETDGDKDGYTTSQGDCDDADATVYPGAPELCDAKDNSCDGVTDEGLTDCAVITTVAGNGTVGYSGDGGPATIARLNHLSGVVEDGQGVLYIADTSNHAIRRVGLDGTITTIAGTGREGFTGDGGPATAAQLFNPYSVALDAAGDLFIADTYNHRIRRIGIDGNISTVAGNGSDGSSGDGGPATNASLSYPGGVSVDTDGTLYIADTRNCRVRRVSSRGTISTVAGTGFCGYNGDGGSATQARLYNPLGVWKEPNGSLYIADGYNHRIRRVSTSGSISTVAGDGTAGYGGDGGAATAAQLAYPGGVATDPAGNLYIADSLNHRIRRVGLDGIISTYAGNGTDGYSGDNGPATAARVNGPYGVALDASGNLFIADSYNNRLRKVSQGPDYGAATPTPPPASPTPEPASPTPPL
jgi:sugar lactone lactonase YvrE